MKALATLSAALLSGQATTAFAPPLGPGRALASSSSSGQSTTSLELGDFFNFGKPKEAEAEAATTDAAEKEEEEEGYYDEDDPIEKIFGVFFGKKEKAPMGYVRGLISHLSQARTKISIALSSWIQY